MIILLTFAFLAGIVTILSPCILPVLPIVLSGSVGEGRRRPLGIVLGFVASFTFFTLFLTSIVRATGLGSDVFRTIAVVLIFVFGLTLLVPQFQNVSERLFSKLAGFVPTKQRKTGFIGGFIVGTSLGLVWTPCVGPILASVISLALTGSVSTDAILITLLYSAGTAVSMLLILVGGRNLFIRAPWLLSHTATIQRFFGIVMISTALLIYFGIDRRFQAFVVEKFPWYGANLTKLEQVQPVQDALSGIRKNSSGTLLPQPHMTSLADLGSAPELTAGGQWFNSDPLTLMSLRGRVVLVDFWTYTCINCIRTLPYLTEWDRKYRDKGLVIIGVHSPEFEFEKKAENVKQAIQDEGILYPVMQDNDFVTWRAYNNNYWPATYFIDKDGHVRFTHFGEGNYDESEQVIQELLAQTGSLVDMPISNPTYTIEARTPELYVGYGRLSALTSPEPVRKDAEAVYSSPETLPQHNFSLEGRWVVGREYAAPRSGARLRLRFQAKNVFLVMRQRNYEAHILVRLDDQTISGQDAGSDVVNAVITVSKDRLYDIIKLPDAGDHTVTLEFLDGNIELYAFTFG